MKSIEVETYDELGNQHILKDARGLQWGTKYAEDGSGFVYLRFTLPRRVGVEYKDIGHGYRIKVRKYFWTYLFDGQIRAIEEESSDSGDSIRVEADGFLTVANDDELLLVLCDKRLSMWVPPGESPKDDYRPDLFNFGTSDIGLFMHANNGAEIPDNAFSKLVYAFRGDNEARRFKADLSSVLGAGVLFEADIDSIDDGNHRVYYTNDAGEDLIAAGATLYNMTRGSQVEVVSVDTGSDYIEVDSGYSLSSWVAGEELRVNGPLFWAQVTDITDDAVSYEDDVGESNISGGETLCNITKKAIATISSVGVGSLDVTDEDHLTGWQVDDIIIVGYPLFKAEVSGVAGAVITYTSATGERVVSSDTGWTIYNVTRDEYATVQSWNIASDQVTVTWSGDISAWAATNVIEIYSPFAFLIEEEDGTIVWPEGGDDARMCLVPHNRLAIDVEIPAGNSTTVNFKAKVTVPGIFDETSFIQLENVRVYSTVETVTAELIAQNVIEDLSASGHDLDDSDDDVEAISKELEPAVFELVPHLDAMTFAAQAGDGSGNLIAWGIRLDDQKRVFLETMDLSTIEYIIGEGANVRASTGGNVRDSAQKVRGVYNDKLGVEQITDWQEDTDYYFEGSFRAESVRLDNIDSSDEADDAVELYLSESKHLQRNARYSVKGSDAVRKPSGVKVPFDELQANGGLVMFEGWRSVESARSATDLRTFTKERIASIEIDYDSETANLIPADDIGGFERYLREMSRMAQR